MGMGSQFSLDLDDRKQYIQSFIFNLPTYSASSYHVTKRHSWIDGKETYWIMERTHDLGGTDYSFLLKINREEAEWLCSQPFTGAKRISEWMDCLK